MKDEEDIDKLREIYEGMSDYEKKFLAKDTVKKYEEYLERLKTVRRAAGLDEFGNELKTEGEENVDGSDGADDEENVAGSGSVNGEGTEDGEDAGETDGGTEDAGQP